jgi:predicted PurR-regulated permease PerM
LLVAVAQLVMVRCWSPSRWCGRRAGRRCVVVVTVLVVAAVLVMAAVLVVAMLVVVVQREENPSTRIWDEGGSVA